MSIDVRDIQRSIDIAQDEYNSVMNRIEEHRYNIRRLKAAKQNVIEQKALFREVKRSHKRIFKEDTEWQGGQYNLFRVKMLDLEEDNNVYYRNSLDRILDSINNEITRLENAVLNELGVLGEIGAFINTKKTEIENAFN